MSGLSAAPYILTTANVGEKVGAMPLGAVGDYIFGSQGPAALGMGATLSGANLKQAGIQMNGSYGVTAGFFAAASLVGTWRVHGYSPAASGYEGVTVFKRIA